MKLTEGTYENLITDGLKQDMLEASVEGLVCKKEDIDGAESPNMMAEHLNRIIRNRLSLMHFCMSRSDRRCRKSLRLKHSNDRRGNFRSPLIRSTH